MKKFLLLLSVSLFSTFALALDFAPDFSTVQFLKDNTEFNGSILAPIQADHKYVVLMFSSLDCGYCKKTYPTMKNLLEQSSKATFRVVLYNDLARVSNEFLNQNPRWPFVVALDLLAVDDDHSNDAQSTLKTYGIQGVPTIFVVEVGSNKVVLEHVGLLKENNPDYAKILNLVK